MISFYGTRDWNIRVVGSFLKIVTNGIVQGTFPAGNGLCAVLVTADKKKPH
jgi:hypothetical protein